MNSMFPNCNKVTQSIPVAIPSMDGDSIAETIHVEVEAWQDAATGEVFLDGQARARLEAAKARHMGLLTPDQIRELRAHLKLTQREIADLLQIGEKSWSRWETGRERPSRSMNVLLNALYDGRIDIHYLRQLLKPELTRRPVLRTEAHSSRKATFAFVRWEAGSASMSPSFEELV